MLSTSRFDRKQHVLLDHDYEQEHERVLVQAERFECSIDMFKMNVERAKMIDLRW